MFRVLGFSGLEVRVQGLEFRVWVLAVRVLGGSRGATRVTIGGFKKGSVRDS